MWGSFHGRAERGEEEHMGTVRRRMTLLWAAFVVALLAGCGGLQTVDPAPQEIGGWVRLTDEQAFKSKKVEFYGGSATTEEWAESVRTTFGGDMRGFFKNIDFKDGAYVRKKEVVFYAPPSEAASEAPNRAYVSLVVISELPEPVGGDKAMIEEFRARASSLFNVPEPAGSVVVTHRGAALQAVVQRSYVDASGTTEFIAAYSQYLEGAGK